jgi:hypothetical protein
VQFPAFEAKFPSRIFETTQEGDWELFSCISPYKRLLPNKWARFAKVLGFVNGTISEEEVLAGQSETGGILDWKPLDNLP